MYNVLAPHVTCSEGQQNGFQTSYFAQRRETDETKQTMPDSNGVTVLEVS